MFTLKFTAVSKDGKKVRFSVREPAGPNAWKYGWERAERICEAQGWTDLRSAI